MIITPPARVKNPFALCDGSWDLRDSPIWTIPNPSRIRPIARIILNIKSDKLFTTLIGSLVAAKHGNAVVDRTVMSNTATQ